MAFRYLLCALLGGAALGGCNTAPIYVEPTAQAILVDPQNHVLLLSSLGSSEGRRLADLIATTRRDARDGVHLEITSSSPALRAGVVKLARRLGVDPYNIRQFVGPADPLGRFRARVMVVAYTAIPPVCPSLSIVGPSVEDNSFDQTLGCSVRTNLALTVADPSHLLGNGAVIASRGDRAAIPVENYRAFATGTAGNRRATPQIGAGSAAVQ
ncbi:CpaD family pilus assembly lipoprotein [Bosea sp. (in: a-proteobacteria)]|jgi:pilus biogenesis lipoprotein CpaD|uniref:CpaD family pilus assembly lipoprotein n=1 Tax=Bosea sp. (in: a-proteobacteria) TaxID=1871050 RepID=UPI003F6EC27B